MRRVIFTLAIAAACGSLSQASADASDDRAVAQQIAQNMKQSGELKGYRVGVKYQNGVAWLMGSVTSLEQQEIAERIARESEGVDRVVCKLEIKGASTDNQVQPAGGFQNSPQLQSVPSTMPAMQRTAQRSPGASAPLPYARTMQPNVQPAGYHPAGGGMGMQPMPASHVPGAVGQSVSYDNPQMPGYAWPSYAAYPNYAALTYPQQYSPSAWPYIGPFYPYPQVPLGWRKVTLEWDDGWWFLDFKDCKDCH